MAAPPTDSPGLFSPAVLRRALVIFVPAALLTAVVVLTLHRLDRENEHALHEQASAHLVDRHVQVISRELKSVESDLLYLANEAILRQFVSQSAADKRLVETQYVLFSRQKGVYDQMRYL